MNPESAMAAVRERFHIPVERLRYLSSGIDLDAWGHAATEPSPLAREPDRFRVRPIGACAQ